MVKGSGSMLRNGNKLDKRRSANGTYVRSWVRKGMMKSVRIGKQGKIRIPVSEIEKFLSKGGDEDGSVTN